MGAKIGTVSEMQKVNTFTQAAFLGSKNLPQNCVIHDKFSAIKSAWFATFQCETPGNSEKYQVTVWNSVNQSETVTNRDTFGFQLLSQTLDIYLHHPS